MNQYDEDKYFNVMIYAYSAEKVADGTEEPKLIGRYIKEDAVPSIEVIDAKVKELGFDTYEISERVDTVKRYTVE